MEQKTTKREESDDAIVTKVKKNQKTIRELFEGYDGPAKLEEADFGESEGKEAW